jgi:hypothetical protein
LFMSALEARGPEEHDSCDQASRAGTGAYRNLIGISTPAALPQREVSR